MIFCHANKNYPKDLANIFINRSQISQVSSTKFLGVTVDERLNWSKHIDLVCKKAMKMLGIFRKIYPLINPPAYKSIYYSFIFPYLSYCNTVWGATYTTHLNKLLVVQKKYLRLISHSNRYAPSAPLFISYAILTINKLNIYQTCLFIHKFIYNKELLPTSFHDFFTITGNVHTYHTRHSISTLYIPQIRTSLHKHNISFHGPMLWSNLSISLRSLSSYSHFKKQLKEHLFL